LNGNEVNANELNCHYEKYSLHLWPTFTYCFIRNKDFSAAAKNKKFTLTGSSTEKNETTALYFDSIPSAFFIPLKMLSELPNVNGIIIQNSNIPLLKEVLFTKEFKVIQHIYLVSNKIKNIETNAFIHLPELKWIDLGENQIESIKTQIFKYNLKMEFIGLSENKIKKISPTLFSKLNYLIEIWLRDNKCVDSNFGGSHLSFSFMNDTLKNCYKNCLNNDECASNVLKLSTTESTTTSTLTTTSIIELTTDLVELENGNNSTTKALKK
jgi:Leucine-rich repeat (LRR) protein